MVCSRRIDEIDQTIGFVCLHRNLDNQMDYTVKHGTFSKKQKTVMTEEWLEVYQFIIVSKEK